MAEVDLRYGAQDVGLRCLSDTAGILNRADRVVVENAMGALGRRFPQLFMAVYTGSLGEIANLRQFGFWLLNRAAFEDLPADKPNEAGVLLTIDPQSKTAGFVFGYLLDPFLDESDTFDCLSRAHAYWLEGRYAVGIAKAIRHLEGVLVRRSRQAKRNPEYFERRVFSKGMKVDQVRAIREMHGNPLPSHGRVEA